MSSTYCCYGDGPLSAVIPIIWPPVVTSQAPNLNSNSALAPGPEPEPPTVAQPLNSTLQAAAPDVSNATLQGNATVPMSNASSLGVSSPAPGVNPPVLAPTPSVGTGIVASPALGPVPASAKATLLPNQTTGLVPSGAPVAAPPASLSTAQQGTPNATLPEQVTPAPMLANSSISPASLPNQTTPAVSPSVAATPGSTPAATPLSPLLTSAANTSQSAEQIAANNALGPLLSPANEAGRPPTALSPVPALAPAPSNSNSSALGASAGHAQTAKAGIGSGAIAGIALAAAAGMVVTASALAFLVLRRRRRNVHSRQPPKPGVLASNQSKTINRGSHPDDPEQGSPVSLFPGARVQNADGLANGDRWQAMEREPLRGALLEYNSTAMSRSGTWPA